MQSMVKNSVRRGMSPAGQEASRSLQAGLLPTADDTQADKLRYTVFLSTWFLKILMLQRLVLMGSDTKHLPHNYGHSEYCYCLNAPYLP